MLKDAKPQMKLEMCLDMWQSFLHGLFLQRIKKLLKPDKQWGPALQKHREQYLASFESPRSFSSTSPIFRRKVSKVTVPTLEFKPEQQNLMNKPWSNCEIYICVSCHSNDFQAAVSNEMNGRTWFGGIAGSTKLRVIWMFVHGLMRVWRETGLAMKSSRTVVYRLKCRTYNDEWSPFTGGATVKRLVD